MVFILKIEHFLPQTVEDVSIRKDPQHYVVCGGVMNKRPLGVDKEDIRDPDLLYQTTIKRHAFIGAADERQPLVLPVVSQVKSHSKVLVAGGKPELNQRCS